MKRMSVGVAVLAPRASAAPRDLAKTADGAALHTAFGEPVQYSPENPLPTWWIAAPFASSHSLSLGQTSGTSG